MSKSKEHKVVKYLLDYLDFCIAIHKQQLKREFVKRSYQDCQHHKECMDIFVSISRLLKQLIHDEGLNLGDFDND